jgi:NhaP-type Na+/H+ and K+/H+ antiporter
MLGEAPSIEARDYLEKQIKQKIPKIRKFINEVSVMPNSSYLSRAKDGIITVQVDALFLDQEVFHPTHVRVITERKTVYLMGSVTKREAEHATNLATKAKNVDKVVKLFNYLLVRPAKEIERDNKRKVEAERRAELEAKKTELEAAQTALQQQINELSTN